MDTVNPFDDFKAIKDALKLGGAALEKQVDKHIGTHEEFRQFGKIRARQKALRELIEE